MSSAFQHRVRNRHPDGGLAGLGTSPCSTIRCRWRSFLGSGTGTAESRAWVYGWAGSVVDRVSIADLDDLAQVHDRHPVGDVADHGEVVGDEQVGQSQAVLQILQEVDDARLDGHVQGRDRFVEDQQRRVEGQGTGDADALALAAGELMGIAVDVLGVEPNQFHDVLDLLGAAVAPHAMDPHGLGDDPLDRHAGVQRGVRILEHDLDPLAQNPYPRGAAPDQFFALELDRTRSGLEELQQHSPGGRLAAPRLPHQGKGLPCGHVEAHRRDGMDKALHPAEQAPSDGEVLDQVSHLEDLLADPVAVPVGRRGSRRVGEHVDRGR